MYYYKIENDLINKYQIIIDEESLQNLKNEIYLKQRIIRHHEGKTNIHHHCKPYGYENYTQKFIGQKDGEDIYLEIYDTFETPYLVEIIDEILKDNFSALIKLNEYKEDLNEENNLEYKNLIDKFNSLIKQINRKEYNNLDEINSTLKETYTDLENLNKEIEEYNKKTNDEFKKVSYKEKVFNCFTYKLVKSYPISLINELIDKLNMLNKELEPLINFFDAAHGLNCNELVYKLKKSINNTQTK